MKSPLFLKVLFLSPALLALPVSAQTATNATTQTAATGPGVRYRITQAEVTGGTFTLRQLRRLGLEMFTRPFTKEEGHGDGPVDPNDPVTPGGRPTTNGTWLRVNGLDAQTCQECHAFVSMATIPPTLGIAGVGGINASAFAGVSQIDIEDLDGDTIANVNGRLINPPFLFGAGGVEMVGKEMTIELQARKAVAQANPGMVVPLIAKGISFGSISYDAVTGTFDTSNVEGIEPDLVVRPFGRKGEFISVRDFDIGALQFHLGMQAAELVGSGVDADGDGVADEVLVGELSVMHIFGTNLEHPVQVKRRNPAVRRGKNVFRTIGCADCHTPMFETTSPFLPLAYPEDATDPTANVYTTTDLINGPAGFQRGPNGGALVNMFSDLKRHDMGPALAETTGSALDPFFITPRLWGIGDTAPYLHDGRALTLDEAIQMHGGEGQAAATAFGNLSTADHDALLIFLDSLRTPRGAAADISTPIRQAI